MNKEEIKNLIDKKVNGGIILIDSFTKKNVLAQKNVVVKNKISAVI